MDDNQERLARVKPDRRILLLPHCLRPSETCPGKYTKEGLQCPEDCQEACVIRTFREEAQRLGYSGLCIAPGGSLALRFVKERHPEGVVAVACVKELTLGLSVKVVEELALQKPLPAVVIIPLHKDGCVNTEVDAQEVLRAINLVDEAG